MRESWFVTHLSYEQKQKSPRELIVSFRNLTRNDPKIVDLYVNYPLLLSTFNIYSAHELENILDRISNIPIDFKKVYLPINHINLDIESYSNHLKDLYGVSVELNKEKDCNFFVVQISIPNDPYLIKNLPSTKISGFQTDNLLAPVKRDLDIFNRRVTLEERLERALIKKDEVSDTEIEIAYIINKLPDEKKHLIREQLFKFFLTYSEFRIDNILTLAEKNRMPYLKKYLTSYNPERILDLEKKVVSNIAEIEGLIKEVDKMNTIVPDDELFVYRIHLQYSPENKHNLNPLGIKGIIFHDHLFDELVKQTVLYVDIEKPLWKREYEKLLSREREDLIKLKSSNKNLLQEDQERITKSIGEIEEKLTYNINGKKIPLYEEKYDAKITNLVLVAKKEDGSLIRQYHKIGYNPGVRPNNQDYELFIYKDEADLINEFYYQVRKLKPFELRNHNIPYDLIQLREAFLKCKLGKKFSLSTETKNPIRDVVRKTYQRAKSPGQEIKDTYRLSFNSFPYLKSRFWSSHKLEDSTRFVRRLRKINKDFKKIATHEELRDLTLLAMHNDKRAELKIDDYTIADIEESLIDLAEYELFDDIALRIKKFIPHVSLTDIRFSPTVMQHLHETIHYQKYHNERYSGRNSKIRIDEKQIFDKRYSLLKMKLLRKNGIKILALDKEEDVNQVYMPVELWLKNFLISIYPLWESYFNSLSENPIERVAQLQYPKYFLKDLLIDYYFYTRERTLYKNGLIKIDLAKEDTKKLFSDLEQRILRFGKEKLLIGYETSFYNLRDHYRSIYEKLDSHFRKEVRIRPWHLYLEQETSQPELIELGPNLFVHDNLDLIKVRNCPITMMKKLNSDVLILFKRFNSTFNTLMEISRKLELLIDKETLKLFKVDSNFPYLLNERRRIVARMKKFKLFYGQDIDDFGTMFDAAFANLAKEFITNNIKVLDLQGDYLLIKNKLPENSMLIPIKTIPHYIKKEPKKDKNAEPSLFEMLQDTHT